MIGTITAVVVAIYAGNWQAELLAQYSSDYCGDGICENDEDMIVCPSCAVDKTGRPVGNCPPCQMICEQDCNSDQDPCSYMDCQYGCYNGECVSDCDPLQCDDGSEYPRCNDDGSEIDYFVDPCDPICPSINCASPEYGCEYMPPYGTDKYGCQVNCGELVCEKICSTVDCEAPPPDCEYINQEFDGDCQVNCGDIYCPVEDKCGNGQCDDGEADVFKPGGCGPNADSRCLGPPAQIIPGSCPNDCEAPQYTDRCAVLDCPYGCDDGHCLPDCKPQVCSDGSEHPRCTPDGHPINYFVDPCFKPSAPRICNYKGGVYHIGDQFKSDDGCNTCFCGEDGGVGCTEMACADHDYDDDYYDDYDDDYDDDEKYCFRGNEKYRAGESFPASDGCNACTCSENGQIACTLMACIDEPPPMPFDNDCFKLIMFVDAAGNMHEKTVDCDWDETQSQGPEYEDEVHTAPVKNYFSDVDSDTLDGAAANTLAAEGVIGGFPDGTFRGDKPVNRAEAAKFLVVAKLGSVGDARNNGHFLDVLEGEWYVKYVISAAELGVISGYPDRTFRPANTVNTAEFLKMLSKAFGLLQDLQHSYTDVPPDAWFAKFAGAAQQYDLFPGRPEGQLQPERLLTRGEVAIAIYKLMSN